MDPPGDGVMVVPLSGGDREGFVTMLSGGNVEDVLLLVNTEVPMLEFNAVVPCWMATQGPSSPVM